MRKSHDNDTVDVDMHIHHETDSAIRASETGDNKDAVWLPKSQADYVRSGRVYTMTMPVWLALDKGLI